MTASTTQHKPASNDWTQGGNALHFQQCLSCHSTWYFHRPFCAHCGAADPVTQAAGAQGIVYASTLVHRAPSDEFRAIVPYRVVLVDMQDGFRMMGHAELDLKLDEQVQCEIRSIAGHPRPFLSQFLETKNL